MRKVSAILLIGIFVFNLAGYKWLFVFMEKRADDKLELNLLKGQYNKEELITIKASVNLPYYNNSSDYQHTTGEIVINNEHFKFVKHRIINDSVEYVCIKNKTKEQLLNARDEFVKLVNDFQQGNTDKKKSTPGKPHFSKNLISEYEENVFPKIGFAFKNIEDELASVYTFNLGVLFTKTVEKPPAVSSFLFHSI